MRRERVVHRLEHSVHVGRPVEEVFGFFDRPANVRPATVGKLDIDTERIPRDLRPGAVFAYRLRHWLGDVEWETLVSDYRPPERFVNVKSRGYFRSFRHAHHFVPEGDGTRVTVVLEYEVPEGIRGALVNGLYLRRALARFVHERLEAIRDALDGAVSTSAP